jgi:FixJ family two-component response regulator
MTQNRYTRPTTVIAIIDDDEAIRAALKNLLKFSGYQTLCYCSAVEFLQSHNAETVQCIVSDIQMPGMSGIEMVENLVAQGFQLPVIFISAFAGAATHIRADLPGFIDCLAKPFDADELLASLERALNSAV